MESPSTKPHADRVLRVLLFLLLVWSFLLRAWVATPELTARRFPDEVFGKDNVRALLVDGQIRPEVVAYPSLSYLPQAALLALSEGLHRLTGQEVFRVFTPGRRMDLSATGYLLCRLLQAVFGTLSLYLTFRIGKRLFSAPVGLGGALLLSVVDWHVRQSVIFKPDILLLLTSLLAFLWSLDAAGKPGWRRYVLAGVGIGLAFSSKYNAAPLAIPLFVATLARGPGRDRRRWAWLVLAGITAAAVFLLLNPYVLIDPNAYVTAFGNTLRHYAKKGAGRGSSHGALPLHALQTLLSDSFHGPVVGALGLLGVAGLAVAVIRRPRGDDADAGARRLGRAMALAYVIGYVLLYSVATTNPSPHNWLTLTPFTSLCAAWTVAGIWRWLGARWPVLARPRVTAAATAPAVLLLASSAQWTASHYALPETWDVARRHLAESLRPMAGRIVYYEEDGGRELVLRSRAGKALTVAAERLDQIPPGLLDRADAELFPEDRLQGDFYRRRLAAVAPEEVVRIRPALFQRQGPPLVILIHPWRQVGPPVDLDLPPAGLPRRRARLPELAPQELGSLELALPEECEVRGVLLAGKPLALAGFNGGRQVVVTARFDAVEAKAPLLVRLAAADGEAIRVRLYRWQR
ncbi:MAG TPA: glycosyltransferase family 39 protein [Thermoanaerobaculia bacterium]|nr:glycosyltransferase family 39 protein [Thermoanaerobaculia bacterium]